MIPQVTRTARSPAVADQQPGEGHPGGARQQRENPADSQSPAGPGPVAQQRGRAHQQGDAGGLHEDELAVGHRAVHQPDRAAEIRPVVVFGDAEQEARTGELEVQPQGERDQGGDDDHHVDRREPGRAAPPLGAGAPPWDPSAEVLASVSLTAGLSLDLLITRPLDSPFATSDAGRSPACAGEAAIARPTADRTGQDGRTGRLLRNLPVEPCEETFRPGPCLHRAPLGGGSSDDRRPASRGRRRAEPAVFSLPPGLPQVRYGNSGIALALCAPGGIRPIVRP